PRAIAAEGNADVLIGRPGGRALGVELRVVLIGEDQSLFEGLGGGGRSDRDQGIGGGHRRPCAERRRKAPPATPSHSTNPPRSRACPGRQPPQRPNPPGSPPHP